MLDLSASGGFQQPCPQLQDIDRDDGDPSPFQLLNSGYVAGAVTCMDACARHPLVAAAGRDYVLRVWNYAHNKCVVSVRGIAACARQRVCRLKPAVAR